MKHKEASVKLTKKQEITKFFQFVIFSISAGLIQILVYTLLSEVIQLSHWEAYLPALICSVLWNFTINRRFTFKSVSNIPIAMMKIAFYYCLFTPISTWWVRVLNQQHTSMSTVLWGYIILIGTMLINFVTEFSVYRFWVYRTTLNTSAAGEREQEKIEGFTEDDLETEQN